MICQDCGDLIQEGQICLECKLVSDYLMTFKFKDKIIKPLKSSKDAMRQLLNVKPMRRGERLASWRMNNNINLQIHMYKFWYRFLESQCPALIENAGDWGFTNSSADIERDILVIRKWAAPLRMTRERLFKITKLFKIANKMSSSQFEKILEENEYLKNMLLKYGSHTLKCALECDCDSCKFSDYCTCDWDKIKEETEGR